MYLKVGRYAALQLSTRNGLRVRYMETSLRRLALPDAVHIAHK